MYVLGHILIEEQLGIVGILSFDDDVVVVEVIHENFRQVEDSKSKVN